MKCMRKRIGSLLLALCMVFSMLPGTALAEETTTESPWVWVPPDEETGEAGYYEGVVVNSWEELENAVKTAPDNLVDYYPYVDFRINVVDFTWPESEDGSVIDLVLDYPQTEGKYDYSMPTISLWGFDNTEGVDVITWEIPEHINLTCYENIEDHFYGDDVNVVVNGSLSLGDVFNLYYNDNSQFTVNGTLKFLDYGRVYADEAIVNDGGLITSEVSYRLPENTTIKSGGKVTGQVVVTDLTVKSGAEFSPCGSWSLMGKLTLENGVDVTRGDLYTYSTMTVNGEAHCDGVYGNAAIVAEGSTDFEAHILIWSDTNLTLSGDITIDATIDMLGNVNDGDEDTYSKLTIAEGSHVKVNGISGEEVMAGSEEEHVNFTQIIVDGTLELVERGAISDADMILNGTLIMPPVARVFEITADETTNSDISGIGTIKMYAKMLTTDNGYEYWSGYPNLFDTDFFSTAPANHSTIIQGLYDASYIADVTIWRNWDETDNNCTHSWGSGTVTTEPTDTTDGERTYTCEHCGTQKVVEIPAGAHILAAPTDLEWNKFYPWGTTTAFDYNGAISWVTGDPDYNQTFEITVYKDNERQYSTTWDYTAGSGHTHWTDWDFSLGEVWYRRDGTYHYTVQALGDGTTTLDSEVATSDTWTFAMPSTKLAAPTTLAWDGTTATWTEDANAAGFVIDVYYSADDAEATSTDSLTDKGGRVWYYSESGDTDATSDFAEQYMTAAGYYYFAVSSVSNDISKNWHSDTVLSPAYYVECAHNWNDGEVTTEATCGKDGVKTFTCAVCGGSKTEPIAATGNHTGGTATCKELAVCTVCGQSYGELADHTSNGETDCTVADTCTVCGETLRAAGEHTWDTSYSKDADGHWYECTVCDGTSGKEVHNSSNVTDCSLADTCADCDEVLRAAGQHDWNETWQTTEIQHWQVCDICETESDKEGHDVVVDPYVAPTLNSTGLTEGSHCSTCGLILVAQETIDKLERQDVSWTVDAITWQYGKVGTVYNTAENKTEGGSALTYTSSNPAVATVDGKGAVTILGAGTTVITATAAAVENKYVETSASYTLTVNKAKLTITANDKTVAYGQAPANDGYTVTGLVTGEDESVLGGTAVYTYTYAQYGKVGEYQIAVSGLTADNYEITFVPGKLTVDKAAAYTIALDNLSQRTGSVTAVTAAVAPQDSTAAVLVEYEIVTPAVACGHAHEKACGEAGATCIHTQHDETCGYAEETRAWTTEVPTGKGTYNVRASLTASENITLPAETVYTTGVLEIKASATIGGGSSGSASRNDVTLDVDSGDQSVAVDVTAKDGTVEVVVTDEALEEILEKVPATGEVVVDLTSVKGAEELVLPAELVTALEENDEVKELTVVSEDAEIVMDADVLATLAETITSTSDKVTVRTTAVDPEDLTELQQEVVNSIAADPVIVELTLVVTYYDEAGNVIGETDLHELNGEVEVRVAYELPEDMTEKNVVVAYVSDDGSVTYIRASYENGYVTFTTDHFSVFVVFASYAAAFDDVDLNAWYVPYVEYAVGEGLMAGISEGTFSPDLTTTRGMIVTILYSLEGKPAITGDAPFADVTADQYYAKAVAWAAANGIVSGYGDGTFGPDDTITREQMAVILHSYAKYKGMDVSVGEDTNILSYNDAEQISDWAIPAFQWACGEGILAGTGNGMLSPKTGATRAQVAAILKQFCEE